MSAEGLLDVGYALASTGYRVNHYNTNDRSCIPALQIHSHDAFAISHFTYGYMVVCSPRKM